MRSTSSGVSPAFGPKPASTYAASMKSSGPTVIRSMTATHADALGEEIAVAVERPGEIEPEHSRAPVRAERLGSDERREERERAPDEERVLAVRDQIVGFG